LPIKKKEIYDEDLLEMMGQSREGKIFEIDHLEVHCGKKHQASATVALVKNGVKSIEIADGCGPVDATLKAIDKIVKEPVRLEEYLVQAITGGSEDTGKVHIQISKNGVFYYGFGNDTDVIYATAKAYIDALNKL
jgi:2-isopropylmalate synthase